MVPIGTVDFNMKIGFLFSNELKKSCIYVKSAEPFEDSGVGRQTKTKSEFKTSSRVCVLFLGSTSCPLVSQNKEKP